jgi:hypothetical protein
MNALIDAAQNTISGHGLNLHGVVGAAAYDAAMPRARRTSALFPATQSIWVIGSGGGALWSGFMAALREEPRRLTEEEHPFDAHVRRCIAQADERLAGVERRWFFAAADATVHLDFRLLAQLAGLGRESRLGLLIHSEFGPWLGLRAACFLAEALPDTGRAEFDPCPTCDAPCADACPAAALAMGRWDVDICGRFHVTDSDCATTCHARVACPVGAAQRYPDAERLYHYNRSQGRQWLRAELGIAAEHDRFNGAGPYWESWRDKVDVRGS